MKKLFLFAATIALLGAGCLTKAPATVEGDWVLAFDLPKGWVMVAPYQDEEVDLEKGITRTDSEVWLQSSESVKPAIKVTHLDSHRLIPEEAESIGDGFFRVTVCDETQGMECLGVEPYEYYFETQESKYKFIVDTEETSLTTIDEIIMSAKETAAPDADYGFVE